MVSGLRSNATLSISWKKSRIGHLTSNTSNPFVLEFDADVAPEESDLIRFFQEGLKPSIKAQIEQRGRELDSWEELAKESVDAEAKAGHQPTSFVREMDQRCPRGNCSAHTTTAKAPTQGSSIRDPRVKEPKTKLQEPKSSAPQRSENTEAFDKKLRKDKKK